MVTGSRPFSVRSDAEAVLKPDPRRFAPRIIGWIICWPWDMLWALFVNNPIQLVLIFFATEIRSALDEISQGEFKDIEQDLVIDAPVAETKPAPPPPAAVERVTSIQRSESAELSLKVQPAPSNMSAIEMASLSAVYPTDPWYAPRHPTGMDDGSNSAAVTWTPPQYRSFNQPSPN